MSLPVVSVPLAYETDVVLARQTAHVIASKLGFDRQDQNYIATAVSEIVRNAFEYGGGGHVEFALDRDGERQCLVIRVVDQGPGIAELDNILAGDFRSATGLGLGIRGARKLMDGLDIETSPGKGAAVTLRKRLPLSAPVQDEAAVRGIAAEMMRRQAGDPLQELRRQSQDLLLTMEELRRRKEEIEALNKELTDTNRGVVALYAELEDRAERLGRADQLKTRFLSHMSHEFRTPLNSIEALARMLLDRTDGDLTDEQARQVGFIHQSARSLRLLVNDLLDLAKVEAGKVELSLGEFSVGQLFAALRGVLRPLARPAVRLVFEADAEDAMLMHSDEAKLSQILRNLISNAIKFTPAGEIRVRAEPMSDDWIVFTVRDTGIGVAPEDQERIFDEFSQVAGPLQKRAKGTGLGLPISRRLAQLLGGDVEVESAAGQGATFTVTLPRRYAATKAATAYHILVVDDDEAFRYIVRQFLAGASYVIGEAADGLEALQYVRDHSPDVVLLDISMPAMDGFEFIERVATLNPAIPSRVIVMTSAVLSSSDRHRLARAVSVLRKDSLSKSTLLSAIGRATSVLRRADA